MITEERIWKDEEWVYKEVRITNLETGKVDEYTDIRPRRTLSHIWTNIVVLFLWLPAMLFLYLISFDWIPRVKNKETSKAKTYPSTYGLPSSGQEEEKKEAKK